MKSGALFLVLVCVFLSACALSGCLGSDDSVNNTNNTTNNSTNNSTTYNPVTVITVTEDGLEVEGSNDNGPSFIVDLNGTQIPKIGEVVEIRTKGNPTTGYEWKASMSENSKLKLLDSAYVADAHAEGMTGVGGTYIWYVTSDAAGTYVFNASYSRSWENESIRSFSLDLTFVE
jgi:Predicted secreted protein